MYCPVACFCCAYFNIEILNDVGMEVPKIRALYDGECLGPSENTFTCIVNTCV